MDKRVITSVTEISSRLIKEIYHSDQHKELVHMIVEQCKNASSQELQKLFGRLAVGGSAHELANILEGADRKVFEVKYFLPCMLVFRNRRTVVLLDEEHMAA